MARRGHNEGSIYKRDDGRWAASLTVGYEGGKRRRKTFYGETRKEVQQKLTQALRDLQAGLPMVNERHTLGQFLDRWLAESAPQFLRPATVSSYRQQARTHILPELGRVPLAKLTPQMIQHYLTIKLESGLSARTVQYQHAILRRVLGQALKWGLVSRNVATLTDPPRVVREEADPLTPDEARRFLDTVRGDRLEALYTVAFAIGLRRGEALALRWQDVDIDAGTIKVRRTVQRIDHMLQFNEPKTQHGKRTLALPRVALDQLRAHRLRQMEERLKAGSDWQDTGLVFTTSRGTPIEPRNAYRSFVRAIEKAGIRHQRFHDTRHACATLLLVQGVSPRVVMEILGHSRIGVTMDIYSHVNLALQQEAARRMDNALGSFCDAVVDEPDGTIQ